MTKSKTKIICTIGPSSANSSDIVNLIRNGMDVARLNFSHGSYQEHEELIKSIREASRITGKNIPVIGDLCGPKVRIGKLEEVVTLENDETVYLSHRETVSSQNKTLPVNYPGLSLDVRIGQKILIDDGLIELVVKEVNDDQVKCLVVNGGLVRSGKGVNFPETSLNTPTVTEKDKQDIEFAIRNKLDFLALSFVRSSEDIVGLRDFLAANHYTLPIISKIEKPQAVKDIDRIILCSDMIMIARGDLGVEMNACEVPILQKEIIRKCLLFNRPVITATQMLESMIKNPTSTRAEASDVANAVFDGTDAVMLSGETSIGLHPALAVKVMHSILLRAEQTDHIISLLSNDLSIVDKPQFVTNLSKAACRLALDTKAAAIIAMTRTGRTARYLAKYRISTPVLAFSPNPETITRLSLCWGVKAFQIESFKNTDDILNESKENALRRDLIKKGDIVVFLTGSPISGTEEINMIKIEKI